MDSVRTCCSNEDGMVELEWNVAFEIWPCESDLPRLGGNWLVAGPTDKSLWVSSARTQETFGRAAGEQYAPRAHQSPQATSLLPRQ